MIINNFSEILGRKKLKITTVSKETGITRPTLTSLYYGSGKGISFDVLNKLCGFLDVSPSDLFTFYPVDIANIEIKFALDSNDSRGDFSGKIDFIKKDVLPISLTGRVSKSNIRDCYDVSLTVNMKRKDFINLFPDAVLEQIEQDFCDKLQVAFSEYDPDAYIGSIIYYYDDKK